MEEFLTVIELSERIKFSKQSLYNLIYRGVFEIGKHYLKPTSKKVLFKWSEIEKWMEDESRIHAPLQQAPNKQAAFQNKDKNLIKI